MRDDLDQGWWDIKAIWDDQVAKINLVGPVVDGKPTDVEHSQLPGEAQNHILIIIFPGDILLKRMVKFKTNPNDNN